MERDEAFFTVYMMHKAESYRTIGGHIIHPHKVKREWYLNEMHRIAYYFKVKRQ